MSTYHRPKCDRRRGYAFAQIIAFLVLLVSLPLASTAVADAASVWQLAPALDLRTATYFDYKDGAGSTTYPAVGAELSLDLLPPERPIAGGLFTDLELTTHSAGEYSRLVGGWVRYRYGRWKLSTVAAHFKSGHVDGLWMHSSKLQFELRPGHKLAIQALGALHGGSDPALQLVYDTYLTQRVSISIKLGLGSNRMRDFGASTKFVWNVY